MNFVIEEIAENARLAAAFYNGFAKLLEGVDDDKEMGFKQFAEVFDIMARYGDDMSNFDLILLAYLAGTYRDEDAPGFDAKAAFGLELDLKRLVDRIGAAKLTSAQINELVPTGQSWERAKETAKPAAVPSSEAATP